jgi:intracellular sulfur oxidation DsrE/DsrF family protein
MKNTSRLIFLLFTMVFSFQFCYAQTEIKEHNIVIQLNTADTSAWSSTIGNIKNIQKAWPNHLHIEVVVHGKAINLLVKDKTYFANDIAGLTKEGIVFSACENTMRKYKIEKTELLIEAKTVPSGVVEVILKQEQGWRYLKAGIN